LENLGMTKMQRSSFWQGKRVLVTGHSGFKGGWLTLWLTKLGADVVGISLAPNTIPNLYELADIASICESYFQDIRDYETLNAKIEQARPEIVFHLAAQPLVRESYKAPMPTFATNIMGTTHVLEALRGLDSVRVAVMITTDKVYRNNEWEWPYREDDVLGGHDPYSASKAASEIVIACYRDAFLAKRGVAVASARAGNVIGGGDWSVDRLLPNAMRAWQNGSRLVLRSPQATRPWQHVLEPLAGYLMLAEKLWQQPNLAGAYNFGPETSDTATVRDIIMLAHAAYGEGQVICENKEGPHEAGLLALEISKARSILEVHPRWRLCEAVNRTVAWYRAQREGTNARILCETEIDNYEALL
jgi:CDP-glucose 4,6-dehydratase